MDLASVTRRAAGGERALRACGHAQLICSSAGHKWGPRLGGIPGGIETRYVRGHSGWQSACSGPLHTSLEAFVPRVLLAEDPASHARIEVCGPVLPTDSTRCFSTLPRPPPYLSR